MQTPKYINGDIFKSNAAIVVNPVNCFGVSGAGLALEFKKRFPLAYEQYRKWCKASHERMGDFLVVRGDSKHHIAHIPTKYHWRDKSDMEAIEESLLNLFHYMSEHHIVSIALPALGCGLGGLSFAEFKKVVEQPCFTEAGIAIEVYLPKER